MVVNELRGEKIDIVPFSEESEDFVMKALSPAKVKEVRIDLDTGTAEVIVPDYQLSLAIGKEGQNARLSARLTGWRIDIKSETQLAEEEAYGDVDWAEGEWITDPETGEQMWQPAGGGPAISAEQWAEAAGDAEEGEGDEAADDAAGDDDDAAADEATADGDGEGPGDVEASAEESTEAEASDDADEAAEDADAAEGDDADEGDAAGEDEDEGDASADGDEGADDQGGDA